MVNTSVKEPLCDRCVHKDVCAYKQDYLDVLKAVENATVARDTSDEKIVSKIIDYDFIGTISISCRYYENWTETYVSRRAMP